MITFEAALRSKDFVITSELILGSQSGDQHINEQAELLRGTVDAVLATDNQSGRLHMSSLAASSLLLQAGIEPIMQLGCRNRNRISLLGDLLGAAALGVRSLQLVRGERVPEGFVPRPDALLDVTATQLLAAANNLRTDDGIARLPDLFLGSVAAARTPKSQWRARKLVEKVDAGARFLILHTCMDLDIVRKYLARLVALQVTHRAHVLVSIPVLRSAEEATWLRDNKINVQIPDAVIAGLDGHADPVSQGVRIAADLLNSAAEIPGVSGAHLYSPTDLRAIPAAIRTAGRGAAGR